LPKANYVAESAIGGGLKHEDRKNAKIRNPDVGKEEL
jgi:hypothetical protein